MVLSCIGMPMMLLIHSHHQLIAGSPVPHRTLPPPIYCALSATLQNLYCRLLHNLPQLPMVLRCPTAAATPTQHGCLRLPLWLKLCLRLRGACRQTQSCSIALPQTPLAARQRPLGPTGARLLHSTRCCRGPSS